jgi:hypothetical protein
VQYGEFVWPKIVFDMPCNFFILRIAQRETYKMYLVLHGHVQRMEENRITKRVLSMKLEATRPTGRPRNRWQDEVSEDGRIVGREEWKEKVYDREEWKKILKTARITAFCTWQWH